jgi:hypothetical protein
MFVKEKNIYSYFFAARFIVSEVVMACNYPNIITYAFYKKQVVT